MPFDCMMYEMSAQNCILGMLSGVFEFLLTNPITFIFLFSTIFTKFATGALSM